MASMTHQPAVYLSTTEAADRIGMNRATFNMHKRQPPPDAVIGATTKRPIKGWLPSTIDVWNANRAGRTKVARLALTDQTSGETFTWASGQDQDEIRDWIIAQFEGMDGIEEVAAELVAPLVRNAVAAASDADAPGMSSEGLGNLDYLNLTVVYR